jgi:hypothetical protein
MEVIMVGKLGLMIVVTVSVLGIEIANRKKQNKTLEYVGIFGKAVLGAMAIGLIPLGSQYIGLGGLK